MNSIAELPQLDSIIEKCESENSEHGEFMKMWDKKIQDMGNRKTYALAFSPIKLSKDHRVRYKMQMKKVN